MNRLNLPTISIAFIRQYVNNFQLTDKIKVITFFLQTSHFPVPLHILCFEKHLKFRTDIRGAQRMNPDDLSDSLTFSLAPPRG